MSVLNWQAIHHTSKLQHCILPAIMTATLFTRIRANHTGPCASAPVPVLYQSLFSPLPKRGAICMTASTLCMLMMLLPAAHLFIYLFFFIEEKVRKEIKKGTVLTLLREPYNGVLDNLNTQSRQGFHQRRVLLRLFKQFKLSWNLYVSIRNEWGFWGTA